MFASPRRLVAAVLAVAAAASAQAQPQAEPQPRPEPQAAAQLQPALAAADAAWARRDEPGQLEALKRALTDAERLAPNDYDVLWRLSRLYFWESDDLKLPDDQKSKLGKQGWDHGERAIAANPKGVEGYFYAAGGMGNYSLGIGVVNALLQGIEGKFRDRLSKAEQIDATYNSGGVYNAWGRFYFKLPFPKYDAKQSESNLRKAIKMNPDNVRARVYLAELYLKESHPKEARKLLEEATANPPGRYDAPEERRYQARAKELLAQNR